MNEEGHTMIDQNSRCQEVPTKPCNKDLSVIRPFGYSVSKCGYCKGSRSNLLLRQESVSSPSKFNSSAHASHPSDTSASKLSLASKSYSVLADSISPNLYEGLINRGWRRSGVHLYKPQNFSSCCPTLTTRLLTREFKPSRSQRKVLKKMENILGSSQRLTERKEELLREETTSTTMTQMLMQASTSKKQKRNHIEKYKMKNRGSEKTDQKLQHFSHYDFNTTKMHSSSLSIEKQVLETGVLQRLEEATINAVGKYMLSTGNNYDEIAQRWKMEFKWKTSYRILPPSKRERKQSQVRAISSICAQICGRLSCIPSANKISRVELVEQVVQLIINSKDLFVVTKSSIANNNDMLSNNCKFSITSVEAHQPSGQILCTIQLKKENCKLNMNAFVQNKLDEKYVKNNGSPSNEHNEMNHRTNREINDCKLAHWYEKTTGKGFDLGLTKQCVTIETLPAHRSALNPDVHRLYAHYQHVVHNDPNPFSYDPNNNNINMGNVNHDDEDDESRLETDDPSELDWGDAPSYFTSRISAMLKAYIRSIESTECRHSVLSNYYSFYQFLVEAPFPLDTFRKNYVKSPGTNSRRRKQKPNVLRSQDGDRSPLPCGLYHQHYRLGGEFLIAVGVIDILPTGLSSVYLFYHPSFSYELVALGKYAILKEIEFARDILQVPYYYLGYYIESCQKMRYKADYKPTQILCPKYYNWVDATMAISKLKETPRHVCPLSEPVPSYDEKKDITDTASKKSKTSAKSTLDINDDIAGALKVLQMDIGAGMNVTIDMLQTSGAEVVKPILKEFVLEFSPSLSKECILKLS